MLPGIMASDTPTVVLHHPPIMPRSVWTATSNCKGEISND